MLSRKLQVGLVKEDKKNTVTTPRETFSERMGIAAYHLESVVKKVAVGVIVYVVVDTVRQVLVEQARNPHG